MLAHQAQTIAKKNRLKCRVITKNRLRKLEWAPFWRLLKEVGTSEDYYFRIHRQPKFWTSSGHHRKRITFDSGGISLSLLTKWSK